MGLTEGRGVGAGADTGLPGTAGVGSNHSSFSNSSGLGAAADTGLPGTAGVGSNNSSFSNSSGMMNSG